MDTLPTESRIFLCRRDTESTKPRRTSTKTYKAVLFDATKRCLQSGNHDLLGSPWSGLAVFISGGSADPNCLACCPQQLATIFESGGAGVSLLLHDGGPELGNDDVIAAKRWLSEKAAKRLAA